MSKTVQTRIKLKYDTLSNWETNNPVLLYGEVALVSVPEADTHDSDTAPVMFKVGDGTNNFKALQWGSAKAADVYSWAKQANPVGSHLKFVDNKISLDFGETLNEVYLVGRMADDAIRYDPRIKAVGETLTVGDSASAKGTVVTDYIKGGSDGNSLAVPAGTSGKTDTLATQEWVTGKGYTTNTGTVTSVAVKVNGTVKGTVTGSGTIDLGNLATSNTTYTLGTSGDLVTLTPSSGNAQSIVVPYAKAATETKYADYLGDDSDNAFTYSTLTSALGGKADKTSIGDGSLWLQINGVTKTKFSANYSGEETTTFNVTAADLGLSAAMKFGGVSAQTLSEGGTQNAGATSGNYTASNQPSNGTVYLDKAGHLEYVWVSGTSSALGHWEMLGQDGSYALNTTTVTGTGALGGGGNLTANRTITHNTGSAPSQSLGFYKFSTDTYSHIKDVKSVTKDDISAVLPDKVVTTEDELIIDCGDSDTNIFK